MADAPSCFLILSEEQLDRKMPRVSAVGGRETLSLGWFSAHGVVLCTWAGPARATPETETVFGCLRKGCLTIPG